MPWTPDMTGLYESGRCPVCRRTEASIVATAAEIRTEVEERWAFHLGRLRPGTRTECLVDRAIFSQRPPMQVVQCLACGTLFRDPAEIGSAVVTLYTGETIDPDVMRDLFDAQRRPFRRQAAKLTEVAGRVGTGLEVGSYVGAFLAAAREEGWTFQGLDVNDRACDFARGLGFRVTRGTLADLPRGCAFDAVTIWNCFEQLPDPAAAAAIARTILTRRGVLAVRVPNGSFYATVRRHLTGPAAAIARALLAHNNLLGFPYRYGFTPASLTALLRAAGFEAKLVVPEVLVPMATRWTRRWAATEERLLKLGLRLLAGRLPAPWFEVYAQPAPQSR